MQISIEGVSFRYGDAAPVLANISLAIDAGEAVALVGHNGSGKTTLVKHLNGLHQPASGRVLINGVDTATVSTARLAREVALLFQNPDDQICKRTIWDEVAFGPGNLRYSRERIAMLTDEALALFELSHLKAQNPHDFGYSVRKRIAMASIVAMDTSVLVFDEPTAGLDPHEISLLVKAMTKLRAQKKTILVISHDMDFVAENMDRAICLREGEAMFDGSVREFFTQSSLLAACGLVPPQIVQLAYGCGLKDAVPLSPEECVARLEKTGGDFGSRPRS